MGAPEAIKYSWESPYRCNEMEYFPAELTGSPGRQTWWNAGRSWTTLKKVLHVNRLKVLAGDRLAAGNHQDEFAFVPDLLH